MAGNKNHREGNDQRDNRNPRTVRSRRGPSTCRILLSLWSSSGRAASAPSPAPAVARASAPSRGAVRLEQRHSAPPRGAAVRLEAVNGRPMTTSTSSSGSSISFPEAPSLPRPIPPPASAPNQLQNLANLYTMKDLLCDTITQIMLKQGTYIKYLPKLITEFLPIYHWHQPNRLAGMEDQETDDDFMRVKLSHCDTVASNNATKFGAVMGTKLDPRVDHVISVRLDAGVEFGLGLCDEGQMRGHGTKRDFMCLEGGFGYYNYKTKSARMKPKYPPGLYCQNNTPVLIRDERDIVKEGDVLTMVIQRQNVPQGRRRAAAVGGGWEMSEESKSNRETSGPIKTLRPGADGLVSLSYFLNGKPMGFNLINLKPKKGGFYLCLNYYFVESTVRILSDWRFSALNRARGAAELTTRSKQPEPISVDSTPRKPLPPPSNSLDLSIDEEHKSPDKSDLPTTHEKSELQIDTPPRRSRTYSL